MRYEAGIKHSQFEVCFWPRRRTASVYDAVHNLGEMQNLQISSHRAVARSPALSQALRRTPTAKAAEGSPSLEGRHPRGMIWVKVTIWNYSIPTAFRGWVRVIAVKITGL